MRTSIVRQISEVIHAKEPNATVILYGSEARGEAHADSDIDLLVLLDKDKITLNDEQQITKSLYKLELQNNTLISAKVLSKQAWRHPVIKTPFYINVVNEGVEI